MIDGVKVVDLVTHEDDRGYLTEIARHAGDPQPHGVVHQFGQVYLVGDPARGTIRAFH
jgi:dTDP-4-dehydrorhamnose 3,5-epimerase-like enzyme